LWVIKEFDSFHGKAAVMERENKDICLVVFTFILEENAEFCDLKILLQNL